MFQLTIVIFIYNLLEQSDNLMLLAVAGLLIISILIFLLIRFQRNKIELQKINLELEKEKEKRIEAEKKLLTKLKRLSKSDELKTAFMSQLSHEVRTPVNSIVNFSSLIQLKLDEILSKDNKDFHEINSYITSINNGCDRLIRTFELLMNISELNSNSYHIQFEKVDLETEIVTPVVKSMTNLALDKGLKLECNIKVKNSEVFIDRHSIRKSFIQVLDNAIKFTKEGEVKINLQENGKNEISLTIEDTGIGISEDYMDQLYEPFSQEEYGYTRSFDGNGLGLTIAKKYCDLNKVELNITSRKNFGTKVAFIFRTRVN